MVGNKLVRLGPDYYDSRVTTAQQKAPNLTVRRVININAVGA